MNRIIKFRAWDGKKITTAWEWDKENRTFTVQNKFVADWMYGIDANDVVLMQFTGLYDRNGKEVWEGDVVVRVEDYKKAVVSWGDGYWKITYDTFSTGIFSESSSRCRVIGNIHEHPHLMETQ